MNDREKLIALVKRAIIEWEYGDASEKIADHLIAHGVVVREKGEWVYDHWCEFKCSKCGALSKTEPRGEENFCPNCGADMRKGDACWLIAKCADIHTANTLESEEES